MSDGRRIGRHVIADISGVEAPRLRDATLMDHLERALRGAGFHVLDRVVHHFEGGGAGFTGVIVLSESHAAVHTYPEAGYLALDVFSCGSADPLVVVDRVSERLGGVLRMTEVERRLCELPAAGPRRYTESS